MSPRSAALAEVARAVFLPALATLTLWTARGWAEDSRFRWERKSDESVALRTERGVVWQFNYARANPKPFFHPLATPDGATLTADRPSDHAWHHGLWFSWVFVNGVNYWEHEPGADRPLGETRWQGAEIETHEDFSARIVMHIEYGLRDQPSLLVEERTVAISPPDARGQYEFDWRSEFTGGEQPVQLACVPIPPAPDGKSWGGYAGLSVRFSGDMKARRAVIPDGEPEFVDGVWRKSAQACDYSGAVDGREAGIALFDHPKNPRHPVTWYAIRSHMSYLNAAVVAGGPLELAPHESLALRYRIVVHPDRWDAAVLAKNLRQ